MKEKIFILFFSIFLFCCKREKPLIDESEIFEVTTNHVSENVIDLMNDIIYKGDSSAYRGLFYGFLDFHCPEEFLFYSFIMANKYDYPPAYLDVYYFFSSLNRRYMSESEGNELDSLDTTSKKIALEYLTKAAEKGESDAKRILGEYYLEGKYVKKDIVKGNKLIEESSEK